LVGYFGLQVVAFALLGVGLLSPLTPSEGAPSILEVGVFLVLPICLSLVPVACERRFSFLAFAIPVLLIGLFVLVMVMPLWRV
jgi:hypothetical protein